MDELPELPSYLFDPSLAGILSLLLTIVLPTVAALFMRAQWSSMAKGLVLLLVAAVKTFLEAWLAAATANVVFDIYGVLYTTVLNFGIAVVAYFGLLRTTGVQQAALQGGVVKSVDTPPAVR